MYGYRVGVADMDGEAYGWGVRDIDEGWGGLWI